VDVHGSFKESSTSFPKPARLWASAFPTTMSEMLPCDRPNSYLFAGMSRISIRIARNSLAECTVPNKLTFSRARSYIITSQKLIVLNKSLP
jgi:hypothetical protein